MGKRVRVPSGTRIVDAVRQAGLPIAIACGASGLCARCGVRILSGSVSVSAETPEEASAKRFNRIDPEQRLSCMATVSGDVQITAPYW
jgi:ferredoxin